ncbi:MAG TPA: hypothetical protein PLL77_14300 [Pyrinomonadaceae bacterium]|nr:hypothetical protein [Pyrinomonadaceae bacterium]
MTDEFDNKLHRTWVELLLSGNFNEAAKLVVNAELTRLSSGFEYYGICCDLPAASMIRVQTDDELRGQLEKSLRLVATGHLRDQNDEPIDIDGMRIEFRIKLVNVEPDWKEKLEQSIKSTGDKKKLLD